jgi:hypothetical protein
MDVSPNRIFHLAFHEQDLTYIEVLWGVGLAFFFGEMLCLSHLKQVYFLENFNVFSYALETE